MHELQALLGAGAIAAALYGLGALIEPPAMDRQAGLERWARVTNGAAIAGTILFAFAVFGLYTPAALAFFALAVALAAGWRFLAYRRLEAPRSPSALGVIAALLAAVALAPALLVACSPTVLWDSAVYHLTLPRLYLEHGHFQPLEPTSPYATWPHLVQLIYGPALLLAGPPAAKLLHFGAGLWLCRGLWLIGCREGRPLAGLVAILLFLANGVVLFELGVAYVDLAHALFLFAAFVFLEEARRRDFAPAPLLTAGLAAGAALAAKFTGALFLAPLAVSLATTWRASALPSRIRLRRLAGLLVLPVLAAGLLWWGRSWLVTGNPVYPFFWKVFGGPDWNLELQGLFVSWQQSIGMGRGFADYLLLPWRIFMDGGRGYQNFDGELAPWLLALLPIAVWQARRPGLGRRALLTWLLFLALWSLGSQQLRFLIPSLPFLTLAIGLGVADLLAPLASHPRRLRAAVATLIVLWLVDFGLRHQEHFRKGHQYWRIYRDPRFDPAQAAPAWRSPLAALPNDAKVLMLNTNESYFCPRACMADAFFEASQIADWLKGRDPEGVAAALQGRGVSHVLLFRQPRPVTYPPALFALLENPAAARPVWRSEDQAWLLFALAPPADR